MDQTRSRGAYRSKRAEIVELGNEPPLSVDGGNSGFVDRRRVSVQWFAGTILTALCGAALMGGAVFTSLDGQANFASLPERVEVALRGALGVGADRLGVGRKADRLPTAEEPSFARSVIRVSTMSRVGNHEVVRVRPFVRIAGNLSLTVSDLSAGIPAYNPQRLLAESAPGGGTAAADDPPAAEPDAEVAFVMRDLPPLLPRLKIAVLTPNDEVIERVREAAEWSEKSAKHLPTAANITGIKLAYAGQGAPDPYKGFEARIVPENITLLPKTTNETTGGNAFNERTIAVKKGDTLAAILRDQGATPDEIAAIAKVLGARGRDGGIKEGQKLRVLMAPVPGLQRLQPIRVIIASDASVDAVVALSDTGKYVSVDVSHTGTEVADNPDDNHDADTPGVTLYQSVYETALRNQIPRPIIEDLVRIYSYDVDFQRKVQPGDSFEVLYAGEDEAPVARQPQRRVVRIADHRRRGQEVLPLPVAGRRHRRLLRRGRKEREEIPGAQAGDGRHHALGFRPAPPSDPRLYQDAHRRRLGGAVRHADLRLRQRHGREGGLGIRLRQIYPHPPHQRLRDRLRPHERLCARHR